MSYVVTGIYTEDYQDAVNLQKSSCKDGYDFDFRFITDEEWQASRTSDAFAFFGGNTIKTQLVIDKIKEYQGKIILVADADVVFLKKTYKKIERTIKGNDMVFLKERKDPKKNPYEKTVMNANIGFVAVRCNERSLKFWETVQEMVIRTQGWDQEIANLVLRDNQTGLKFTMFSDHFLNGGEITPENVRKQMICTACGTVAKRNRLSKTDYLRKMIQMSNGTEKYWFDGKTPIKKRGLWK